MAEFIVPAIIAAAAGAVAGELLRPKPPSINPLTDHKLSEAAVRGTLAPLMLGHNRVAPVFGWVGNRRTWQRKIGSVDGGWFSSDDDITQTEYRESAMHIIGIGPAKKLLAIYEDGKNILTGLDLTPSTFPSGSSWSAGGNDPASTFQIYWGEADQPVCAALAAHTEVYSNFPYCCYIYWTSKELGTTPLWKQLDYVVECATLGEDIDFIVTGSSEVNVSATVETLLYLGYLYRKMFITTDPAVADFKWGDVITVASEGYEGMVQAVYNWVDHPFIMEQGYPAGTYAVYCSRYLYIAEGANVTITLKQLGEGGQGVNPILAMRQLMFESPPHGQGLPSDWFDTASLDALIPYFEEGGTEPSPASLLLQGGRSYKDGLALLMQDYGILCYPDATTGLLTFKLLRDGDASINIQLGHVDLDKAVSTKAYSVLSPEKTLYSFVEASRSFQSSTILVGDDGQVKLSGNPNTKRIQLGTVTDMETASMVVSRKDQESKSDTQLTLEVSTEQAVLNVGQLVTIATLLGSWRVMGRRPDTETPFIETDFVRDAYSLDNQYTIGDTTGVFVGSPASPDTIVMVVGGNRYLNSNQGGYYLLRVRNGEEIAGAILHKSVDGGATYGSVGSVDYRVGGFLNEAVGTGSGGFVTALEITAGGDDFASFWNITLSDAEWRGGYVIALIGTELVYVQSITIIGAGVMQLNNVLRARLGTSQEVHSIDDPIVFFYKASPPFVSDSLITSGDTVLLKSVPYTTEESLELTDITAVTLAYGGGGYRPLACENLNTDIDVPAWVAGTDVNLRWDYKNGSSQSGAGFSLAGEPVSVPAPEGLFKFQLLTTGDSVVWEANVSNPSYDMSNSFFSSHFGGEPTAFKARVTQTLNGLTSDYVETTFTRV